MAYILDPISIATRGYVGPIPSSGDYCPAPLAIASIGYIRFPFSVSGALADPWHGKNRFIEPFDRGYFLWKYGPPKAVGPSAEVQPSAEDQRLSQEAADLAELEEYIEETNRGIISGLTAKILAKNMNEQQQGERLLQLQENVVEARTALILALEHQRITLVRKRNVAAIEAAIRFYF